MLRIARDEVGLDGVELLPAVDGVAGPDLLAPVRTVQRNAVELDRVVRAPESALQHRAGADLDLLHDLAHSPLDPEGPLELCCDGLVRGRVVGIRRDDEQGHRASLARLERGRVPQDLLRDRDRARARTVVREEREGPALRREDLPGEVDVRRELDPTVADRVALALLVEDHEVLGLDAERNRVADRPVRELADARALHAEEGGLPAVLVREPGLQQLALVRATRECEGGAR